MGHLDHGHLGGWSTGDGIDKAAFQEKLRLYRLAVEKAKTDPNRRYYGAHVLGHGYVDVQALFAKIAGALGAQRFCNRVGNFNPVDLVPLHLTDWDKYAPPYSRQRPPAGWFPKANGLTYVFKQYWQVSRPVPWFWPVKPPQGFDRSQNTYFEISLITWFYADIGDYETRLDINVVSIPVLDQRDQQWGYRATPLQRHQKVAAQICEQLFTALKNNLPSPVARERRAVIVKMIDDAIAAKRAEAAGKAPAGATPAGASSTGSVSTPVSAASSQGGQANASTVPNLPAAPASGADLDSVIGTSVDDGGVASGAEPGAPAAPSGDLVDAGLPDGGGDAAGSSAQAAGTATVAVRIPAPRLKER